MDQVSRLDSMQFALNALLMLIISFSAGIIGLVFLSVPHIEYYDDEAWLSSVIASVPSYCLIALAASNLDSKKFQEFLAIVGTPWILFASIVLRCRRLAAPRRVCSAQSWKTI